MRITENLAKMIPLLDDDTEFGGKSHADEMLDEFMEEAGLPFGMSLTEINEALKECGLQTYTAEQIKQLTLTR